MSMTQLTLPWGIDSDDLASKSTWTPRDLWVKLDQRLLELLKEDRRLEKKSCKRIHFDDLAAYYSAFSNCPDGGLMVYGVEDKGEITGCQLADQEQLNQIESVHLDRCPQAKPEFKRIKVIINNKPDYCLAIFLPYIGRLVETNKGDAWIRYGSNKHKMSDEEKRDFRSTRRELSFEQAVAPYNYPEDFDLRIIQDFCDSYRDRENRDQWTNEEVLVDRYLLIKSDGKHQPSNALVLMAALDPRRTIPGCRVRIQRFATTEEGSGTDYNPIQDRFIEGNIVNIIKDASTTMEAFLHDVTWLNKEGKFVTDKEYPRWAWFESLVNACVHRSYSFSGSEITAKIFPDRLEIESPGGFVPPVNEQTIYHTRSARNHHLMDALRYLGYVRMAREGTRRIRDSMANVGLPEPTFSQEAIHGVVVKVVLKNDQESRKRASDKDIATFFGVKVWKQLEDHEIALAGYAYRNKSIQVSEAQRLSGRTWATSKKDLERLVKKGVLVYEPGRFTRDPKATYKIADKPMD
ncbi:ATP-binding protein [Comamonas sp.]|uniref:ATP-binding protein n=1 Tax=Comamonas sp. TaxID=34028 RepID=UPI003D102808